MQQRSLFDRHDELSLLEEKFWQFHHANPQIYEWLKKFALEWQASNPKSLCSIAMLYERVRWEVNIYPAKVLGQKDALRLNNNHKAYYARLLEEHEPDLKGIFRMRKQRVQASIGPLNNDLEDNIHLI
jgi:hypothetical protein